MLFRTRVKNNTTVIFVKTVCGQEFDLGSRSILQPAPGRGQEFFEILGLGRTKSDPCYGPYVT